MGIVAALFGFIIYILLCANFYGVVGVIAGIIILVGVIAIKCREIKKAEQESALEAKEQTSTEIPEITTDDLLAMYCADKVWNKTFKL